MTPLTLSIEATQAIVDHLTAYEALDPADDFEFGECDERLLALHFMFKDILRQVGADTSEPTVMETVAREMNRFYVAILVNEGRNP